MSIIARHHPTDEGLPPVVTVQVVGLQDLKRFKRAVDRSLNCDPEAGADLFKLCDDLEALINKLEGK